MKHGCLGVLGVILLLAIIAVVRAFTGAEPEMVRMTGEGVVSAPVASAAFGRDCRESSRMFIVPSDGDVATVEIERATQRPDGSCAFAFAGEVPDADEYTFELSGVDDVTIPRSMMDTTGANGATLSVRLSW